MTRSLTAPLLALAVGILATPVIQAADTEVPASDDSVVASPYNWAPDASAPGALKAWNPGAYLRFAVQGATAITVRVDPKVTVPHFRYAVDNGPTSATLQPSGDGRVAVALPDTGRHEVWVYLMAIPEAAGRWDGTLALGVQGITIPEGGRRAPAQRRPRSLLIFGDSITEGIAAKDGASDNQYDWSYYVGQQFLRMGYEYGVVACGSSGYTTAGAGGVPNAFKPGDDANSWWNKVNATTPRVAKGLMVPQPDIIIENWGANDGLQGHTGPGEQAAILGLWKALRGACPAATIVKVVAFGGYAKADVTAAYAGYGSADAHFHLVDLDVAGRQQQFGGLHPGIWGHANLAALVAGEVLNAVGAGAPRGASGRR